MLDGNNHCAARRDFWFRGKGKEDTGCKRDHWCKGWRVILLAEGTVVENSLHLFELVDGHVFYVNFFLLHPRGQLGRVFVEVVEVVLLVLVMVRRRAV